MGLGQGQGMNILLQPGRPYHQYKNKIEKSVSDFVFTERWNWTPQQIKELSNEERLTYHVLLGGVTRGEYERQKREMKK